MELKINNKKAVQDYIDAHIIQKYDLSPYLREEHDKEMERKRRLKNE